MRFLAEISFSNFYCSYQLNLGNSGLCNSMNLNMVNFDYSFNFLVFCGYLYLLQFYCFIRISLKIKTVLVDFIIDWIDTP